MVKYALSEKVIKSFISGADLPKGRFLDGRRKFSRSKIKGKLIQRIWHMVNAMLWAEYTANWLGSLRFNFGLEAVHL